MTEYKGYYIEKDFCGGSFYTVQFCGDDVAFDSIADAKKFIDEITDEITTAVQEPDYLTRQIITAEDEYTGGNVYVYFGEIDGGLFYMAEDTDAYDVLILNADPRKAGEDAYYPDWQKEHTVAEFCDTAETLEWFSKMYTLIETCDSFCTIMRSRLRALDEYRDYLRENGKI